MTEPRDVDVLVLAPRFPSINQPWIDTYLEQLQRAGYSFRVASSSRSVMVHQEKVGHLGLMDHRLPISLSRREVLLSGMRWMVQEPLATSQWFLKSARVLAVRRTNKAGLADILHSYYVHRALAGIRRVRVIHSHSIAFGYPFLPEAAFRKVRTVITFHGLEPRGVPQVAEHRRRRQFDLAARVIVNTEFARTQAEELGCPPEKIIVLPQGLPLVEFPFVRKPPPEDNEPIRLLTVGRFHRDKGHRYALLAARRLLDRQIAFHWDFVGVGPDREKLKRFSRQLELGSRVELHEAAPKSTLGDLYRSAHIFVLPSISTTDNREHVETQGVVLQEAQASGCIPIATSVGGIPECINQGRDGILISQRSHRAIESAIVGLLERRERWPELQNAARKNVEDQFSADVIGDKMAQLLSEQMI